MQYNEKESNWGSQNSVGPSQIDVEIFAATTFPSKSLKDVMELLGQGCESGVLGCGLRKLFFVPDSLYRKPGE